MIQAAVGQNRIQMGTIAYLVNLNQGAELALYLSHLKEYNYSQALQNQAQLVRASIMKIHSDLKNHEGILKYVPSTQRSQLANWWNGWRQYANWRAATAEMRGTAAPCWRRRDFPG